MEHTDVSLVAVIASGAVRCPSGVVAASSGNILCPLSGGRHRTLPPTVPVSHSFRHPPCMLTEMIVLQAGSHRYDA